MVERSNRVGMADVDSQWNAVIGAFRNSVVPQTREVLLESHRLLVKRHAKHFGLSNKYGPQFKKA